MEVAPKFGNRTRTALWIAVIAALAALVAAVAVHSYSEISRELTDSAMSRRVSVAGLAATTLGVEFHHIVDVGISLGTETQFRKLVAQGKWRDGMDLLRNVPSNLQFVDRIFLTDTAGNVTASEPDQPDSLGRNLSYRDWYKGVIATDAPYVSGVYKRVIPPQLNVFSVAIPVRDDNKQLVGLLVLQARPDVFFDWAREIDIGPESIVYVVDRNGQVAFHSQLEAPEKTYDYSTIPIVRQVLRGRRGVEVGYDPVGKEDYVSAYAPVSLYGWGVIAQQPADTAFAIREGQLRRLQVAYGLILLCCALTAFLMFRIVMARRRERDDYEAKQILERRVAERTEQLEATNRELEGFSYSVSHDLRTPLRAIDGYSRMLEEDVGGKLGPDDLRKLDVIRDSTRRMSQLIDDLLAFSRLGRQSMSLRDVDMEVLAREVWDGLTNIESAARDTPPQFNLHALPAVKADISLLRQVWVNLLSNAIKFTSKNEHPAVDVIASTDGTMHIYCIKDNGVGFDMKYYNKLFGVFQRLHSQDDFAGTGVGLAIVQRVIVRHGGKVWADSTLGQGAAFYFSLPMENSDG